MGLSGARPAIKTADSSTVPESENQVLTGSGEKDAHLLRSLVGALPKGAVAQHGLEFRRAQVGVAVGDEVEADQRQLVQPAGGQPGGRDVLDGRRLIGPGGGLAQGGIAARDHQEPLFDGIELAPSGDAPGGSWPDRGSCCRHAESACGGTGFDQAFPPVGTLRRKDGSVIEGAHPGRVLHRRRGAGAHATDPLDPPSTAIVKRCGCGHNPRLNIRTAKQSVKASSGDAQSCCRAVFFGAARKCMRVHVMLRILVGG